MANRIFSTQRTSDGDLYFAEQVEPPFRDISASLVASASLTATPLSFVLSSASLLSTSSLTTTLQIIQASMQAAAVSNSSVAAGLTLADRRMVALLSGISSVQAQLIQVEEFVRMAAALQATPTLSASIVLPGGSNISNKAKLRAVPLHGDRLQLTRHRGDTYADCFQVFDDRTGEAIDVTGCTFRLALATRKNPTTADQIIYTLFGRVDESGSGVVLFSPTEGQADRVGFFYYDMEMNDHKGMIKTLVSSSYVYKQDITK